MQVRITFPGQDEVVTTSAVEVFFVVEHPLQDTTVNLPPPLAFKVFEILCFNLFKHASDRKLIIIF